MQGFDSSNSRGSIHIGRLQQEGSEGNTADTTTAASGSDGDSGRQSRGRSTGAVYDADVANQ
jgi:hypothetical protein